MPVSRRKLTFQLTPLLDLLLIVIFAQFMEVEQTSAESERTLDSRLAAVEQREAEFAEKTRQKTEELKAAALAAVQRENQRREAEYRQRLASINAQQEESGRILAEFFKVPESTINQLLRINPNEALQPRQATELKQELGKLQQSNGRELLRMLTTYSEMKKRCNIWEVHVTDDDVVEFDNGENVSRLPFANQKGIEDSLFNAYKDSPEPRTLVILLFTYGDAGRGVREPVRLALTNVIDRMRKDRGGRNWFEYVVLGYTPDGPSLRSPNPQQ